MQNIIYVTKSEPYLCSVSNLSIFTLDNTGTQDGVVGSATIGSVAGIALQTSSEFYIEKILIADITASAIREISCLDSTAALVNGNCLAPTSSPTESPTNQPLTSFTSDSTVSTFSIPITFSSIVDVAVSKSNSSKIFVADSGANTIYLTTDDGLTWSQPFSYTSETVSTIQYIEVDASDNLFVSTDVGLILYYNNGGTYDNGRNMFPYPPVGGVAPLIYSSGFSSSLDYASAYVIYTGFYIYLATYYINGEYFSASYLDTLSSVVDIALDPTGTILYLTRSNYAVYKYTISTSTSVLVAGTGTYGNDDGSTSASFSSANMGIGVGADGNIYVVDSLAIRMISTSDSAVYTLAGQKGKNAVLL